MRCVVQHYPIPNFQSLTKKKLQTISKVHEINCMSSMQHALLVFWYHIGRFFGVFVFLFLLLNILSFMHMHNAQWNRIMDMEYGRTRNGCIKKYREEVFWYSTAPLLNCCTHVIGWLRVALLATNMNIKFMREW